MGEKFAGNLPAILNQTLFRSVLGDHHVSVDTLLAAACIG